MDINTQTLILSEFRRKIIETKGRNPTKIEYLVWFGLNGVIGSVCFILALFILPPSLIMKFGWGEGGAMVIVLWVVCFHDFPFYEVFQKKINFN